MIDPILGQDDGDDKFEDGLSSTRSAQHVAGPAAPSDDSDLTSPPGHKEARDTISGCRERASADLASAAETSTENGRRVLERSAASWDRRADELQALELGQAEQRRVDKAIWDDEENSAFNAP
jgi:hypothetical protein